MLGALTKPLVSTVNTAAGLTRFSAHVSTGDKKGAGTNTRVWLKLVDSLGNESEACRLDKVFISFKVRGETQTYHLNSDALRNPDEINHIVVWRDGGIILDDRWFLDKIELEDKIKKIRYIFPCQRWICEKFMYNLYEFDAFLPQFDHQLGMRNMELARKKEAYDFKEAIEGGPMQVKVLPDDEKFSEAYMLDLAKLSVKLNATQLLLKVTTGPWNTLEDVKNIYKVESSLYRPVSTDHWTEDKWFGLQRVKGVNAVLITLCKRIPEKFPVGAAEIEPFMEGLKLQEALDKNKIFIVDLEVLDGVPCKPELQRLPSPIALFYLNKKGDLMPVAIQLYQEKSPNNPMYFPSDPQYTWIMAKMFYNMADAQVHQSSTHLGLTHLLMESMSVSANRNLSRSHPIYRLLAPHFLYLMAINAKALDVLVSPGGWVDNVMSCGRNGMFKIVSKNFSKWRLDVNGDVEKELMSRGVLDPAILPNYPYREDAVPLFNIIKSYVTKVVNYFYDTPEKLAGDMEVQNWVKEMSTPRVSGGLGIGGMPVQLETLDQLIAVCTSVVSTCSMGHASANFQQYDEYGFVPNYPTKLVKLPPQTKRKITEKEMLDFLPDKATFLEIMLLVKILSTKGTKSLGDFEVQYLYNPEVVVIADEFRLELKKLSNQIKLRNKGRELSYEWLDPEFVPNAISI